jgi:hypothetical protein
LAHCNKIAAGISLDGIGLAMACRPGIYIAAWNVRDQPQLLQAGDMIPANATPHPKLSS